MRKKADGRGIVTVSATTRAVAEGEMSLDDWDDEELMRGTRRSKNGKFTGPRPTIVPIQLHRELTRRRLQQAHAILAKSLTSGAKMLHEIIEDPQVGPRTKLRAIELLFNRVLGRPAESVSVNLTGDSTGDTPPWLQLMQKSVVGIVATAEEARQADGDVIEGEIVEAAKPKPKRKPPAKKQPAKRRRSR